VGTKLRELDGRNWRQGNSEWFVLEACEYRRSFLFYEPSIILLTNADIDHLDYYKTQEDYRAAFVEFMKNKKAWATIIVAAITALGTMIAAVFTGVDSINKNIDSKKQAIIQSMPSNQPATPPQNPTNP
jgi:UDP-N-acetylmuramate-alanine ligase